MLVTRSVVSVVADRRPFYSHFPGETGLAIVPLTFLLHSFWSCAYSWDKPKLYSLKPGFHYTSWRPELTGDQFPWLVNTGRVDGRPVSTSRVDGSWKSVTRQLGPSTRVVETGLNTVFLGCALCLIQCTSIVVQRLIQSASFLHSTCPNHLNLVIPYSGLK